MADPAPNIETADTTAEAPPRLRLKPGAQKRLLRGHPWVYSNEIEKDPALKSLPLGVLARVESSDGEALGTACYNRLPLIAARLLTRDPKAEIDADFLAAKLRRALAIRERLFEAPYYRLIHAEADGLPGAILDRFGDAVVLQNNSAAMERLAEPWLAALDQVLAPKRILLRNDSTARKLEGLETGVETLRGGFDQPLELIENGARYLADPGGGQKTGWFFDQRENRAWAARFAKDARVLDGYCYTGGFAIQAALAGAREVVAVDRSEQALVLAERAAALNGVATRCRFERAEIFSFLQRQASSGERYDLVIVDPPAFIKSRKELWQGAKGYRKLARLAAGLVAEQGTLFIASCSHHMAPPDFAEQVRRGVNAAGREARILRSSGAAADHPVHPALPESAYLKALTLALD